MTMKAESGKTVHVHYTGSLDDGSVFDTSENREPLKVTLGAGQVIKGFDNAIHGMGEGEEKTITLEPALAYGKHHEKLVYEVPVEQIQGVDVKPGVVLTLKNEKGAVAQARCTAVNNGKATLDMNHPLAGKNLTFKIKLMKVE